MSKFLLGAATAAHQVEGNNVHSDSWALEYLPHSSYAEPSGDACDHYHRFEEDIKLMADAGLNAYRFSLEWARIEPMEGQFDENEIEHYRTVIRCCREHGLEPVVTLHHFSSPAWLMAKGGWEAETTPADFEKYVRYVAQRLGNEFSYICTINEANIGLEIASIAKQYAAQTQSAGQGIQLGINLEELIANQRAVKAETRTALGTENPATFTSPRSEESDAIVIRAHELARNVLQELCPNVKIGLTLSLHDVQAIHGGETLAQKEWEDEFAHYLPHIADDDFLGVQNYTRSVIGPDGSLPAPEDAELTQMGYEFYPEGLEHVLRRVAGKFKGELLVTENGIATEDDSRRSAFIETALAGVSRCVADGLPVRGYFYWSLLDNFEWQKGYAMTFGLVAVDRASQTRTPKPSLHHLGQTGRKLLERE